MDKIILKISLGVFLLVYSAFTCSATLIVDNGALMGATGVDVNGILYDVSFVDGTCIGLFNSCNENTDFPFTNPDDLNNDVLLRAAMQALLDQVFIDSQLGAFDSQPELMNGCNISGCAIGTPLWVSGAGGLGMAVAFNWVQEKDDVISFGGGGLNTDDTSLIPGFEDSRVYAVWNQSAVVPVPAAIWLFVSGLAGLFAFGKKRAQ